MPAPKQITPPTLETVIDDAIRTYMAGTGRDFLAPHIAAYIYEHFTLTRRTT